VKQIIFMRKSVVEA